MDFRRQANAIATAARGGAGKRVVAPGGMGKTHLLEQVADALAGVRLVRWSPAIDPDEVPVDGDVLLADDVHLASTDTLRALARWAGGVVAAHRPAQRDAEELLDALDGAPVVLGPLTAGDVGDLLTAAWGHAPDPAIVDELVVATGGVARLVVAVAGSEPIAAVGITATLEETVRSERQRLDPAAGALLDASAVLPGLDLSLLAAAVGVQVEQAATVAGCLTAAGLALDAAGRLAPVIAEVVRPLVPASEVAAMVERAALAAVESGIDVTGMAEHIRTTGVTGPATARCLLRAARRVLDDAPGRAHAWIDAAGRGGAVPGDLAAMQALISFRQGRAHETVAAVDDLLRADPDGGDSPLRREAVEAAAVVLGRRGAWDRCADLAAAVGASGDNAVAVAAIARLAVGDADGVRDVTRIAGEAAAPGLRAAAAAALARGLAATFADDPAPSLPMLLDAARLYELSPPSVPLPEGPHALAAVVACHLWEFDVAAQILADPPAAQVRDRPARERLLAAWVALRRGDWVGALAGVEQVRAGPGLDARDGLVACAVDAGVARRRGDLEAMDRAWRESRTLLLRQVPDLLSLQPVGELLITGARLQDRGTVRTTLASMRQMVTRTGHAPLWAQSLLWDEMHMAVALGDTDGARTAATAGDALPARAGRAEAVTTAAVCWTDALTTGTPPERVRTAAAGLADAGLVWEASRLAGAAAIRTADSEQMRGLLQFARGLTAERTPLLNTSAGDLSPRERDVAAHLLAGLTYREIGGQLYIAPKTVEHHVARIRRKLGVRSRAELLAALRRHVAVV